MKIICFCILILIFGCTRKLENSSQKMAETSTALQESTKLQMDQLLIYIEQLNTTMKSLDQNFTLMLQVMTLMNMNLAELAKLSPTLQKFIADTQTILQDIFKTSKTPNQETENIEDLLKE